MTTFTTEDRINASPPHIVDSGASVIEMNANELADFVEISKPDDKAHQMIATMLRRQHAEIDSLRKNLDVALMMVDDLEKGLDSSINLNKAQAERQAKTLTNEEILCLWDWWSGEILATDILDFADTYKRVLLGEEGLLEWHQEYVKRMNKEHDLGIAEAIGFDKGYKAATAKTLTAEEITELTPWNKHPYESFVEYTIDDLVDFARAILKKASEK
jgi:hypothetical protein